MGGYRLRKLLPHAGLRQCGAVLPRGVRFHKPNLGRRRAANMHVSAPSGKRSPSMCPSTAINSASMPGRPVYQDLNPRVQPR